MEIWQALVLGLVEGITEFLPVSSTGHLLVTQKLMGLPQNEATNAFAIAIQAGAMFAVFALYRARIIALVNGLFGKDPEGRSVLIALVVAFLPAAILGVLFDELIELHLFGPWPVVGAWAVGGLVILLLNRRIRKPGGNLLETLEWRGALIIGLAQCLAMWPGVSRSLAAILGGIAVGLSLTAAVEFAFLLGLVTLGAATAYKAVTCGALMLETFGPLPLALGFITALVSAVVAVRWMVAWLNTRGLAVFGWWRLIAAAGMSFFVLMG